MKTYALKFKINNVMTEVKVLAALAETGVSISKRGEWNYCYGMTKQQVDSVMRVSAEFYAL